MDRRDALRKLAIGGAAVGAASVVTSSPAFAYATPTPPSNPTVVEDPDLLGKQMNVTLSSDPASCNGGASNGVPSIQAVSYVVVAAQNATALPSSGSGSDGSLTLTLDQDLLGPPSVTIAYSVRYRCTYDGTVTETCKSWVILYTTTLLGRWDEPEISPGGTDCPP